MRFVGVWNSQVFTNKCTCVATFICTHVCTNMYRRTRIDRGYGSQSVVPSGGKKSAAVLPLKNKCTSSLRMRKEGMKPQKKEGLIIWLMEATVPIKTHQFQSVSTSKASCLDSLRLSHSLIWISSHWGAFKIQKAWMANGKNRNTLWHFYLSPFPVLSELGVRVLQT